MTTKITPKEQYTFYIFIDINNNILSKKDYLTDEDALEDAQELAQEWDMTNVQVMKHIGYRHRIKETG